MPTVSIIIPAYNVEATILETIQSIQAQTFSDFELIVINDGSTDSTLARVGTVEDSRIKVFSYENGGLPVARNRGIRQATGEFITFIDADDLWTPDKLEKQLVALEQNPEAGVAYSWTAFIDERGKFLYAWKPLYDEGDVYPKLLVQNFISSGSNILVRRQFIEAAGEFDPNLKSVEDWDYYLRLAARCPFVVVPEYQILYRQSSRSMTAKVDVMETANLIVIERAFQAAPPELQFLKNQSLARVYRYLAKQCIANAIDNDGLTKAQQKLTQSLRFSPKSLLERETVNLAIKLFLFRILPVQTANRFIKLVGQKFPLVPVRSTNIVQDSLES